MQILNNAAARLATTFQTTTYFHSIDLLRGVAALMVVFFHFTNGNPARFADYPAMQSIANYGQLGVQVFFIISGFVIPYSMWSSNYRISSFLNFFLKRLTRLEPPYIASILVCLIMGGLATLSPMYRGAPFVLSLPQVLSHLAYVNVFTGYQWLNPVYWSLAIEFQYYLTMALIFPLLVSEKRFAPFLVLVASIVLSTLVKSETFIFAHLPFFCIGITIFLLRAGRISATEFVIVQTVLIASLAVKNDVSFVIVAFATLLAILFVREVPRIGIFLGSISYSLYLLHVPIGGKILNFAEQLVKNQFLLFGVLLLTVLIMIVASWIFMIAIERPSQKLSKRIRY